MIIIGWDIGIKNLAYCIFKFNDETEKITIVDWNIIDLRTETQIKNGKKCTKICLKDLSLALYETLENNKNFKKFDYIIIENQPVLKNPTMKSVQMILYSYFAFKSVKVKDFKDLILMNASNKLKVYTKKIENNETLDKINKIKSKYSRNKKLSILHTELLLSEIFEKKKCEEWLDFFSSNKKKDDLADSFLMNLFFLKKNKYINI
jgi:hypothetical protein